MAANGTGGGGAIARADFKIGDMSGSDMLKGLMNHFGVSSQKDLLKQEFVMAHTESRFGKAATMKDLGNKEVVARLYRSRLGQIPGDPANKQGAHGAINGTNVLNEFRPKQVFQVEYKSPPAGLKGAEKKQAQKQADETYKAQIKNSYRKLAATYHPDNQSTGDRKVFEELKVMRDSLMAF